MSRMPKSLVDYQYSRPVLRDLDILTFNLRIVHTFECEDQFDEWFRSDTSEPIWKLVWVSVFPSAVSAAFRILDRKNSGLRKMLGEFQENDVDGVAEIDEELQNLRKSSSWKNLEHFRHDAVAHSRSPRHSTREFPRTLEAIETLSAVASLAKRALELPTGSLPAGFPWEDVLARRLVEHLFQAGRDVVGNSELTLSGELQTDVYNLKVR